jgi:serine/threonine protein kinase
LYVDHPAFHQLLGWNISKRGSLCELYLFHDISKPQLLKLSMLNAFTPTEKTVLLYGIARGMQHLHSLKIVHRDLKMVSIFVTADKYPHIGNFWYAKGDHYRGMLLSDYPRVQVHHAPEVINNQPFTFESDVYSFAILAYEVMEGRAALIDTSPRAARRRGSVMAGQRPAFRLTSTDPEKKQAILKQQAIVKRMWDQHPSNRLTIERIVTKFEKGKFWFHGTDPIPFYLYKGYVDAFDRFRGLKPIIDKVWVTRVASLQGHESELSVVVGNPGAIIARALSYITVDSGVSQEQQLEAALRSSFSQSRCIDPSIFADYVHNFLSDCFPVPWKRSIFGLNPVTRAIIDLGDLRLGKLIHSGGYATVFQGELKQGSCARTVAVKKVTPSIQDGQPAQEVDESIQLCSALGEILIGLYCEHPAVLNFFGWNYVANVDPHELWIVTELMPRGNVGESLHVDPTQKMIHLYGTARGLAHLHMREIVHRDVKPENIFLDSRGFPYVGDFGFATFHDDPEMLDGMGTTPYMAPEMIDPDTAESADFFFPADVYSYAITFWEIVTEERWQVEPEARAGFTQKVTEENYRPPLTCDSLKVHAPLLTRMWHPKAGSRPKFRDIVEILEQERFWLPGTDRREFLSYIQYLNRGEKETGSSSADVHRSLRQIALSQTLIESLNDTTIFDEPDTLTAKLIKSLEFVSGMGETQNKEVERAVRESLTRHGCLNAAEINQSAAEPVNPQKHDEIPE